MPEVYFVGCGPGDPDLITIKGANLIKKAGTVVYSGSLIPQPILDMCSGTLHDASGMVREEITQMLHQAALRGEVTVRLHDGDPTIYGAVREQIDSLNEMGVSCTIIPGVTAMLASAAALRTQLTLPSITQTIIMTRMGSRTDVPERESIKSLAAHRATMVLYLSIHLLPRIVREAIAGGYPPQTPTAVIYRASWEDERVIVGTLQDIQDSVRAARITRTATIIIGDVVNPSHYEYSRLYDKTFTHGFRTASPSERA